MIIYFLHLLPEYDRTHEVAVIIRFQRHSLIVFLVFPHDEPLPRVNEEPCGFRYLQQTRFVAFNGTIERHFHLCWLFLFRKPVQKPPFPAETIQQSAFLRHLGLGRKSPETGYGLIVGKSGILNLRQYL